LLVVCVAVATVLPGFVAVAAASGGTEPATAAGAPEVQTGTANGTATSTPETTPTPTPAVGPTASATANSTPERNLSRAARVANVTFVGPGRVDDVQGQPALLGGEDSSVAVGLWTGNESGTFIVCLSDRDQAGDPDTDGTLACRRRNLPNETTTTVEFPGERLGNRSGLVNLSVTLSIAGVERTELDRANASAYVFEREGDFDGDGLSNAREFAVGADPTVTDTDRDGLADGPEVKTYRTDPTSPDTDGDGRRDGTEIREGTDPNRADSTTTSPPPTPTPTATEAPPADTPPVSMGLLAGVLAVVPLVAVGYLVVRRRSGAGGDGPIERREAAPEASQSERPTDRSDRAKDAEADEGDDDDASGRAGIDRPDAVPEVVMSDEERVLTEMEEAGGRLPQQTLVQRFDWSKSKVSRVTSRLADRGDLVKLQVGRRNLLVLPGEEPANRRGQSGNSEGGTAGIDGDS
jgi:hypothetical protein